MMPRVMPGPRPGLMNLTRKCMMRFCHLVKRQKSGGGTFQLSHRGVVEIDGDDSFK